MQWLIVVLAVAVLGVAAVVASGGLGEMRRDPVRDVYRQDLPDRPLTGRDIDELRFATALRGYAMDQVDDVLARLGAEIAERDDLIEDLRGGSAGPAGSVPVAAQAEHAAADVPATAGGGPDDGGIRA